MSELFIELALIAMVVVPAIATSLHPVKVMHRGCAIPPRARG